MDSTSENDKGQTRAALATAVRHLWTVRAGRTRPVQSCRRSRRVTRIWPLFYPEAVRRRRHAEWYRREMENDGAVIQAQITGIPCNSRKDIGELLKKGCLAPA